MARRIVRCGAFIAAGLAALAAAGPASSQPEQSVRESDVERSALARARDGGSDFDFQIGRWQVRLRRLESPLSGSTRWLDYEGAAVVTEIWPSQANIVRLDVSGPDGSISGLSPRFYNPVTREWRIHWVSSGDGVLDDALVGGFDESGVGRFYNQETLQGRAILVRIVISNVTAQSFQLEQAFSSDGGVSWEPNWLADFSR